MSFAALLAQSEKEKEDWRYTSLKPFAQTVFAAPEVSCDLALPEPVSPVRVVFVNGVFCPGLSQVKALPEGFIRLENDGFCHLEVAEKTCLALQSLGILFFNSASSPAWEKAPRIKISLGANSRLTIIEKHVSDGGPSPYALMPQLDVDLAPQSKLLHGKIVRSGAGLHASHAEIVVSAGAFYDHYTLIEDGTLTRCAANVHLKGELAGASLAGATLLRGASHADYLARIFHEAPHGTSRQMFKTVLDDKAHGVFQGKIHVAPHAQKTDGYQLSRALLLSPSAEMDAKPELEIFADDVKCSHGSSIGDLDAQELFYLRSRGLPEQEARAMLVEAFVREVVDQIPAGDLHVAMQNEVDGWLRRN